MPMALSEGTVKGNGGVLIDLACFPSHVSAPDYMPIVVGRLEQFISVTYGEGWVAIFSEGLVISSDTETGSSLCRVSTGQGSEGMASEQLERFHQAVNCRWPTYVEALVAHVNAYHEFWKCRGLPVNCACRLAIAAARPAPQS